MRPRTLSLLLTVLFMAAAVPADAEMSFGGACLIQATPFYQKLLHAGVFDAPMPPDNTRSMALLFKMARSFRYKSDKKKRDAWQSADQTSQYFSGDCEDKAIWLYTQMRRNGYRDVSLHIGKYGPSSQKFHMWVTYVDTENRTILLDPTMQRKPWDVSAFPERNYRSSHILSGEECVSL